MIYLDNNATTRPFPEVVGEVACCLESGWANPSSQHGIGQEVSHLVELARERLAALVGVTPNRIVFTSGATEGNEAILRHYLQHKFLLVTSEAEHPAVNGLYRHQAPDLIRMVKVDADGLWNLDDLKYHLLRRPALVTLSWANGETGVLQNALEVCRQARARGMPVLVDASQVVGRVRMQAGNLGATYLTLSGHKLHGPKGVGALIGLGEGDVVIQFGGGQERGRRGGTENVPGIVGLGVASQLLSENLDGVIADLANLRDRFETVVLEQLSDLRINGAGARRIPNTSNISFRGVDGMALVARLEDRGIICSQVSACSSGSPEPSRILTAMGRSVEEAFSSVRFAFAKNNTLSEAETAAKALVEEVTYLRETMGAMV